MSGNQLTSHWDDAKDSGSALNQIEFHVIPFICKQNLVLRTIHISGLVKMSPNFFD